MGTWTQALARFYILFCDNQFDNGYIKMLKENWSIKFSLKKMDT